MVKEQYITCPNCGRQFVNKEKELRKFFKRYYSKGSTLFHTVCKDCENKMKLNTEWKDGKLLCHICGEYLPEEMFGLSDHYPLRNNKDARCTKCRTNQANKRKLRFTEKEALCKMLLMRYLCAKNRANKYKIPFTIDKEFLIDLWNKQKGLCAISNIPMTYKYCSGRTPTNISIDQINPHLGYTRENVLLVCMAVNQMKSDMSLEELYMFCEAIIEGKK